MIKWLTCWRVDWNGAFDRHRMLNRDRLCDLHQMALSRPDLLSLRRHVEPSGVLDLHWMDNDWWNEAILSGVIKSKRSSLGEQSDGWHSFAKKPRLTRDRGPIVARSWPDRRRSSRRRSHSWTPYDRNSIALKSKPDRQAIVARSPSDCGPIAKRSWPDRQAIMARSPSYRGPIAKWSCPRFRIFHYWIKTKSRPQLTESKPRSICPLDAIKPPPQPLQLPMIFGPISPLKPM